MCWPRHARLLPISPHGITGTVIIGVCHEVLQWPSDDSSNITGTVIIGCMPWGHPMAFRWQQQHHWHCYNRHYAMRSSNGLPTTAATLDKLLYLRPAEFVTITCKGFFQSTVLTLTEDYWVFLYRIETLQTPDSCTQSAPSYSWLKNGEPWSPVEAEESVVQSEGEGTITFQNPRSGDEGKLLLYKLTNHKCISNCSGHHLYVVINKLFNIYVCVCIVTVRLSPDSSLFLRWAMFSSSDRIIRIVWANKCSYEQTGARMRKQMLVWQTGARMGKQVLVRKCKCHRSVVFRMKPTQKINFTFICILRFRWTKPWISPCLLL